MGGWVGGWVGIYLDHLLQEVVGNAYGSSGIAFHVGELLFEGLGVEEPRQDIAGFEWVGGWVGGWVNALHSMLVSCFSRGWESKKPREDVPRWVGGVGGWVDTSEESMVG